MELKEQLEQLSVKLEGKTAAEIKSALEAFETKNSEAIEGQVKVMMEIMQYIKECSGYQIYWTVENNSIGEAALVVIRDTGEENFPGEMLHEPRKIQGKKGRKGFHTTHKSKMESCLVLKRLVENDKTINNNVVIVI